MGKVQRNRLLTTKKTKQVEAFLEVDLTGIQLIKQIIKLPSLEVNEPLPSRKSMSPKPRLPRPVQANCRASGQQKTSWMGPASPIPGTPGQSKLMLYRHRRPHNKMRRMVKKDLICKTRTSSNEDKAMTKQVARALIIYQSSRSRMTFCKSMTMILTKLLIITTRSTRPRNGEDLVLIESSRRLIRFKTNSKMLLVILVEQAELVPVELAGKAEGAARLADLRSIKSLSRSENRYCKSSSSSKARRARIS